MKAYEKNTEEKGWAPPLDRGCEPVPRLASTLQPWETRASWDPRAPLMSSTHHLAPKKPGRPLSPQTPALGEILQRHWLTTQMRNQTLKREHFPKVTWLETVGLRRRTRSPSKEALR